MKVVILNSGGLDSALEAKRLKNEGHEVHSLFLEFAGQIGLNEIKAAAQETANRYCNSHHIFKIDLGYCPNHYEDINGFLMYDDYLADNTLRWLKSDGNIPHLWSGPPNQSSLMISLAISYAKAIQADAVSHGYYGSITEEAALAYEQAMMANNSYPRLKPNVLVNDPFNNKIDKLFQLQEYEGEFDYVSQSTPGEL